MKQQTGNWTGKTVACAVGQFSFKGKDFDVIDLPGTYSLTARSEEEEIARDYICSGHADMILIICDATCLERGLHLLKQIEEINGGAIQAKIPSSDKLEYVLPDMTSWEEKDRETEDNTKRSSKSAAKSTDQENQELSLETCGRADPNLHSANLVLCVNLCDEAAKKGIVIDFEALEKSLGIPVAACSARERHGLDQLKEILSSDSLSQSPMPFHPEMVSKKIVSYTKEDYRKHEEKVDRFLTGKFTGSLVMLLLLVGIFWLTITGANYPSSWLWDHFFKLESILADKAYAVGVPDWIIQSMIFGVYRVVAWIISVMLPPMAIFFPLFTLLEDLGYLPRIAFNMDGAFKKCKACGKQCLTMCQQKSMLQINSMFPPPEIAICKWLSTV